MDKDNTTQKTEEVKKESAVPRSVNQETKSALPVKKHIIELNQTISFPRNLDFVPANNQIQHIPVFAYQRPVPRDVSPVFEVPPSNIPRHRQFYDVRNDFLKDYFHPHIHSFINNYAHDDLYFLPPYHGCGLKNRNGTRTLIDYRNGKQCLSPDWSSGKDIPDSLHRPFTRFMSYNGKDRICFKNKGNCIFNYNTNQFDHLSDMPVRDSFQRFL